MNKPVSSAAGVSSLRQRLIDDMNMRRFSAETQRNYYIRDAGRFATFLARAPDTAAAEDLRRFQVEQREAGVPAPTMNSIVSALRFFFTHTLDRPDLARRLVAPLRRLLVILDVGKCHVRPFVLLIFQVPGRRAHEHRGVVEIDRH